MTKFRMALMIVCTFSATGTAYALELPYYDVEANCNQVSGYSNKSSTSEQATRLPTRNYCIDREQQAYDYVKDVWDNLSEDEQRHCIEDVNKFFNKAVLYQRLQVDVTHILAQREFERNRREPHQFNR
jgi:hypothetical protein